ncbi:unnamed protein product, partial [Ectocarpus sp. 12 AP-2014]
GQLEGQVDELRAALEDARRGTATEEAATARARAEAEELQGKLDSRCHASSGDPPGRPTLSPAASLGLPALAAGVTATEDTSATATATATAAKAAAAILAADLRTLTPASLLGLGSKVGGNCGRRGFGSGGGGGGTGVTSESVAVPGSSLCSSFGEGARGGPGEIAAVGGHPAGVCWGSEILDRLSPAPAPASRPVRSGHSSPQTGETRFATARDGGRVGSVPNDQISDRLFPAPAPASNPVRSGNSSSQI